MFIRQTERPTISATTCHPLAPIFVGRRTANLVFPRLTNICWREFPVSGCRVSCETSVKRRVSVLRRNSTSCEGPLKALPGGGPRHFSIFATAVSLPLHAQTKDQLAKLVTLGAMNPGSANWVPDNGLEGPNAIRENTKRANGRMRGGSTAIACVTQQM
jgi:hypothetical protein